MKELKYILTYFGILGFLVFHQSCSHEGSIPGIDPNPNDTMTVDTMPEDTSTVNPNPCDPNVVYFEKQILPILVSNCALSGCHDAITAEEDIILNSYANVINSDVVKAFDLSDSELYEVITENDEDKVMPPPPATQLNSEQINLIVTWILQGTKNLDCDENVGSCNTTGITYSGFVSTLISNKCQGCHSSSVASGGVVLDNHAGVQKEANNGRLYGVLERLPGYPTMPKGLPKLADCDIAKIKSWIDAGAPNN